MKWYRVSCENLFCFFSLFFFCVNGFAFGQVNVVVEASVFIGIRIIIIVLIVVDILYYLAYFDGIAIESGRNRQET